MVCCWGNITCFQCPISSEEKNVLLKSVKVNHGIEWGKKFFLKRIRCFLLAKQQFVCVFIGRQKNNKTRL